MLRLQTLEGSATTVDAYKAKRPRFARNNRQTWDSKVVLIDGKEVSLWYDSTWGRNFYFEFESVWYRLPLIGGNDFILDAYRPEFQIVKRASGAVAR